VRTVYEYSSISGLYTNSVRVECMGTVYEYRVRVQCIGTVYE
jgi:hypothetical protein